MKQYPSSGYSRQAETRLKILEKYSGPTQELFFQYQTLQNQSATLTLVEYIAGLEKLLKGFPEIPEKAQVLHSLGLALERNQELPEAMKTLRHVAAKYPDTGWGYLRQLRIGQIYFKQGDFSGAIREFKRLAQTKGP